MLLDTLRTMACDPEHLERGSELAAFDIDSLDIVELTQVVEEEWHVRLDPGELKDLATAGEVIDAIAARLS